MKHKTQHTAHDFVNFGALVRLSFQHELDPLASEQMMTLLVRSLVLDFMSKVGFQILRIKAFLKCPTGYIRADITKANGEVFTESAMKRGMKKAELAVNIVTQGLSKEEVKTIFMEVMEKTITPLNGRFSTIRWREKGIR